MNETLDFVVKHGYSVLFFWVLAEQFGLPLPAAPLLMAAGALAGMGRMSLALALLLAVAAAVIADAAWYELGRRRGGRVLNFLCRMSLEPDSCVRRTEERFAQHGARSLVLAKFLPGFSTVAPPLAGIFGMRFSRFLFFDAAGSLLWAGSFMSLGWIFNEQLERVAVAAESLGGWLLAILLGALAAYVGWKFLQRQLFLRQLRIARIRPEELKQKLDAGESIYIVDLRHSMDFAATPETIPGAVAIPPDALAEMHGAIPRDREIVLYCT
jgi:membrane protein DedA with SNARE-associated domain